MRSKTSPIRSSVAYVSPSPSSGVRMGCCTEGSSLTSAALSPPGWMTRAAGSQSATTRDAIHSGGHLPQDGFTSDSKRPRRCRSDTRESKMVRHDCSPGEVPMSLIDERR